MEPATHKVEWLEHIEKFGKPALKTTLSVGGQAHDNVTIYKYDKNNKEFPGFDSIMPGAELYGKIYTSDKGYKSFYAATPKTERASIFKSHQMEKMAADKREFIGETLKEKENGIRLSSCNNQGNAAAVAIFDAEMRLRPHQEPTELWKKLWDECRNHLWNNWDKVKDNPPF